MSFSHPFVVSRTVHTSKSKFFDRLTRLIDWSLLDKEIKKHYTAGQNAVGQHAYSGLLLFKMHMVGYWMGGLSDRLVEEAANENLSVMRFLGLQLEDSVPDHSVLSRFRSRLSDSGALDALLDHINLQLISHGVMVKQGAVSVDASITDTPRRPKGKPTYEIPKDRFEDTRSEESQSQETQFHKLVKKVHPGVDHEARFVKKAGKLRCGHKKSCSTDQEGLVLSVVTTAANTHDSKMFEELINKANLPKKARIHADKAYKSKKNNDILEKKGLKNGIQYKGVRGRKLTEREIQFNKLVSKSRYVVERTFGSQVRWFGAGTARYVGTKRTHGQHVLESIAYNLKRLPVLWINKQNALTLLTG